MSTFPSVNLVQAALFNSSGVTIQSGKTLTLAGNAATGTHQAVSKLQLESEMSAVTQLITDLTSGAPGSADTLKELYDLSVQIDASGIAQFLEERDNRIAAITQEVTDRNAAILVETNARSAADNAEVVARDAAILVEKNARTAADTTETTARIAKDADLDSRLFTIRNVACAGGVYADAQQPSDIPTALLDVVDPTNPNIITDDGWYYKNPGQIPGATAGQKKINWYTAPNAFSVSDLKEINMPVNLINHVSAPFFTIYTKFQGPTKVSDGNGNEVNNWGVGRENGASWYHGKYTFIVPPSVTSKGKYNFRASTSKIVNDLVVVDGSAPHNGSYMGFSNVNMIISTLNSNIEGNSFGLAVIPFRGDDQILACSFGTDSGSSAGNVEFILSAINYYCSAGNVGYRFNNADVLGKKLKATMNLSP